MADDWASIKGVTNVLNELPSLEKPLVPITDLLVLMYLDGTFGSLSPSFFPSLGASLVAQLVKNRPAMLETWVRSLSCEDLLEKGKATHCSILAWRIPWTAQSTGSQRVRHD